MEKYEGLILVVFLIILAVFFVVEISILMMIFTK